MNALTARAERMEDVFRRHGESLSEIATMFFDSWIS